MFLRQVGLRRCVRLINKFDRILTNQVPVFNPHVVFSESSKMADAGDEEKLSKK